MLAEQARPDLIRHVQECIVAVGMLLRGEERSRTLARFDRPAHSFAPGPRCPAWATVREAGLIVCNALTVPWLLGGLLGMALPVASQPAADPSSLVTRCW